MPRPTIPDRRNAVLDRARDLFLEKGYDRTTMAEIARRAGVGKGAVYLEFPSKEALLDALLVRSTRSLTREVRALVAAHGGPVPVSAAWRFGVEALLHDEFMLACYLAEADVLGGYLRRKGPRRYGPRLDWLVDFITESQQAGVVRADLDPRAAATVMSVFAVGLASTAPVMGPLSRDRLRESVDLFADLVAAGWETSAPDGREAARQAHARLLDRLDSAIGRPE
ncbi:TetR/AcrR family transcriptional regulator [Marinitenerispora sediminis]|uniref:TetR/AcrR family transcriptional regulator n=1 Tax=Marinitenerispora sediminis TaxID=1931232 RepID=A0A368SYG2_9ACTN|nr:TetR/AcrR family transcriptional regulator [Marinitenerispora sediminis]RCV47861.1 TetR/AcrR family transcriptional regulator [Marinitenerispora sediminis]RCV47971.1 TetR/AcrR family transcriptional regulator [Marinitenerispora sediminis]RCV49285.1 TetR/AcrR family transcriptional regulator [Marinitenerispora sediminis]